MYKVIKLNKGLDINLSGQADRRVSTLPLLHAYGIHPADFKGVTPKMLVKQGDEVKVGTALFFDKYNPEVLFTSPVSGIVSAINRGDKRKIMSVVVTPLAVQSYESFRVPDLGLGSGSGASGGSLVLDASVVSGSSGVSAVSGASADLRDEVIEVLLKSGLWPTIIQRPYGVIANREHKPKAIFVSSFSSAPLAADMNFVLEDQADNLAAGFKALASLTEGKVHLSHKAGSEGVLNRIEGIEHHYFKGAHPAGNIGVQIHHLEPINKGEVVWTVDIQNVAIIGRLMRTGKLDMTKTVALVGSEVSEPHYVRVICGAPVGDIARQIFMKPQEKGHTLRLIDGDVLTGKSVTKESFFGCYNNMLTVISEGDHSEFLGWAMPRMGKFSVSKSYFSWLRPKHAYAPDTNLNGGVRAFVVTGLYEKYLPMDIYPLQLLKAILAEDIEKMENLGIYEVVEEDFALCEYVDPSKINMQEIVRQGIELMIKELG